MMIKIFGIRFTFSWRYKFVSIHNERRAYGDYRQLFYFQFGPVNDGLKPTDDDYTKWPRIEFRD